MPPHPLSASRGGEEYDAAASCRRDIRIAAVAGFIAGAFGIVPVVHVELAPLAVAFALPPALSLASVCGVLIAHRARGAVSSAAEVMRFLIVGGTSTLLEFGILNALFIATGLVSGIAFSLFKAVTYLLGFANSYAMNKLWTFGMPHVFHAGEFARFSISNAAALVLNVGIASLIVNGIAPPRGLSLAMWANIGAAIAVAVAMVFNFLSYKYFVFTHEPRLAAFSASLGRMRAFLATSRYALLTAVIALGLGAGLIAIAPELLIRQHVEGGGTPYLYNLPRTSNVEFYQGFIHEVYEGHTPSVELSDENRGVTYIVKTPVRIAALFLAVFNDDKGIAYLAMNVAEVAAIFALLFFIGRVVFEGSLLWSFAAASIGAMTRILFELPNAFFSIANFKMFFASQFYPLVSLPLPYHEPFFKLIDPTLTIPFLLAALLAFYMLWEKPTIMRGVLAGVLLGVLFNVYFFYWIYMGIFAAFLFILSAITYRSEARRFWAIAACGAVAIFFFVPYALEQAAFLSTETGWQALIRVVQVQFGRHVWSDIGSPLWPHYVAYILLIAMAFSAFWRSRRDWLWFYAAAIAAAAAVWSVQLITGYIAEPFHFLPGISVVVFVMLSDVVRRLVQYAAARFSISERVIGLCLILPVVLVVARHAVNASYFYFPTDALQHYADKYRIDPNIIASWDWMNANLPRDARVASPSYVTTNHLNNYTYARPYLASPGTSLIPNDEILKRYLVVNKLFEVPQEAAISRLSPDDVERSGDREAIVYRSLFVTRGVFDDPPKFSGLKIYPLYLERDEKRREVIEAYSSAKADLLSLPVEYLYVGPDERAVGARADFSRRTGLKKVYENDSVSIYHVSR